MGERRTVIELRRPGNPARQHAQDAIARLSWTRRTAARVIPCVIPRVIQYTALFVLATLIAACATRPPANALDRPVTHALPASADTPLSEALAPLEKTHPGASGFVLLPRGAEALQMRVALARAATKTLDMQYYIADEDVTGKLMLAAALYAADRGVHVRLLVDDLNFKDIDNTMAALNTHPNIEVRVFNPFGSAQQGMFERTENVFTKIDHFTRRMHNKAMIADNQIAVVGGRNLSDEYFGMSQTLVFRDLDVFAAGPVTHDISASFDTFWNSSDSYPLSALNKQRFETADLDATRDALRAHWRDNADAYNAKPLDKTPLADGIAQRQLDLTWAKAEFRGDSPSKITAPSDAYRSPPMHALVETLQTAQREVLILSPYFVPHDGGVKLLGELTKRGARVAVLTNSMASTDAISVQAGYSPYRVPLLENGVELYEYKPVHETNEGHESDEAPESLTGSESRTALHAKVYVIDRSTLVIGSMNLDPRSAKLNTELALFIHSPPLANQVAQLFDQAATLTASYRLRLATPAERAQLQGLAGSTSRIVWTSEEPSPNGPYLKTWTLDPEAGLYRNALTGLFLLLPVDSEL
ncbi:phospholipase D family protein [Trinickia violacea]|uniref:Phospholipase D family protein n=1 Tax=Trinickia violacea TaxID=2571746 RepID=A0A4P8ITW8_9BURK|nr:phospholipase D family protein [Trinickia violacea]QCP50514.1 phospholipase D family protein [Trinickia violacea]